MRGESDEYPQQYHSGLPGTNSGSSDICSPPGKSYPNTNTHPKPTPVTDRPIIKDTGSYGGSWSFHYPRKAES